MSFVLKYNNLNFIYNLLHNKIFTFIFKRCYCK